MNFNRRQILKSSAIAAITLPVASVSTLSMVGCSTSWIDTAIADIPTAEAIANSILGIVALATGNGSLDASIAVLINTAGTAVTAGLATLQALITDYKTAPNSSILDKIDVALTDLQTNLGAILQVAKVKDSNLQISISTAVGLAIAVVSAIQTLVPAAPVSSAIRRAAPVKLLKPTVVPKKEDIASLYNAVMVLHGFAAYQVK